MGASFFLFWDVPHSEVGQLYPLLKRKARKARNTRALPIPPTQQRHSVPLLSFQQSNDSQLHEPSPTSRDHLIMPSAHVKTLAGYSGDEATIDQAAEREVRKLRKAVGIPDAQFR
jgi:hypothetical protein